MINAALFTICLAIGQAESDAKPDNPDAVSPESSAKKESVENGLLEAVKALIEQLNDESLERRQAAETKLFELGAGVLDALPDSDESMPQEVKSRLQRVRERLEEIAAKEATSASRLTLKGEMTLTEAIAEIEKQTENKLYDIRGQMNQPESDPPLELDFEDAPFWEVWESIMDQASLKPYSYGGQMRTLAFMGLADGETSGVDRVAHSGPFRFEATRIVAVRDLRNPNNESLRLTMEITWEPRMVPISIRQPMSELVALDDDDDEIDVDGSRGTVQTSVQNTVGSVELDIPLTLPSRELRNISALRGEMTALVPGREATFQFDDIGDARNVEKKNAGVIVTLQRVRRNADIRQILVSVRFAEAQGALETYRGWIFNNQAFVVSPDGAELEYASFETTRQQDDEVGLAYNFTLPDDLTGYKFIYKTPAAIVELPVKYELNDIALP